MLTLIAKTEFPLQGITIYWERDPVFGSHRVTITRGDVELGATVWYDSAQEAHDKYLELVQAHSAN